MGHSYPKVHASARSFCEYLVRSASAVDLIGMSKQKYPEQYKCIINFETGESDCVPEMKEERQARLRREANRRRSAAFADTKWINEARWDAVTEAWRLGYAGRTFPIHFDLVLVSDGLSRIERYTLVNAAFTTRIGAEDEMVGSKGGIHVRRNRPSTVPADFVHRA